MTVAMLAAPKASCVYLAGSLHYLRQISFPRRGGELAHGFVT